jgi:hypothetical protein
MAVHDLPAANRLPLLRTLARDGIVGERIYDAQIAEIARAVGARVVSLPTTRHLLSALRHRLRIETPGEFVARPASETEIARRAQRCAAVEVGFFTIVIVIADGYCFEWWTALCATTPFDSS